MPRIAPIFNSTRIPAQRLRQALHTATAEGEHRHVGFVHGEAECAHLGVEFGRARHRQHSLVAR